MKKLLFILAITIMSCNTSKNTSSDDFVKGELLVGISTGSNVDATIKKLEEYDGVSLIKKMMDTGETQIVHFSVPKGKENDYITLFTKNPHVKYAEVNGILTTQTGIDNTTLNEDAIKSKTIVVLKVNHEEVACYGAHGKQQCLQIKELGIDREWQNQYEGIEGFDFVPGFVYNLQVEKIEMKNPPQDVSAIFYKLIKIIKKEKPISDTELSDYATLTVVKIENGKDGYSATLKNDAGNLYMTTISIPNLEDNYVRLEIGDKVKIAGDYAESYPVQIFAKKIKIIEPAKLKKLPELTVTKVIGEKDGETVHLTDGKNNAYTMIVSIPNLGNGYVRLKVGDKVKVEGEYIDSFPTQIFAKTIYKLNNNE